ncbi:MAG: thiamine phosphate synthase [Verrucomicrobiae bacterium]|nr:thiamine phosphate synthase [Verrucomicrobiae bacterium]MDW7980499.1 thiamine phosphate synthase [Verrucomicrobiales bacterium]
MRPLEDCRLYTFVDTAYLRGRAPELVAQQLCDGGADIVQLRAKGVPLDEVRRMAERILPIVRRAGVGFVVNDHPSIAREVGADFCHLGQEDFFDTGYKHVSELGLADSGVRVGLSTHAPEQAQRAVAAGAHYIAVGPVFTTATKPTTAATTLEYVRWAAANINIPWFAIGGITLGNLDAVLEAGARRICVVSAILGADDVARACAEFRRRLG